MKTTITCSSTVSIVAADEIASLSSSSPPLGWARTAGGPAAGTLQAVRHNTGCSAKQSTVRAGGGAEGKRVLSSFATQADS